MKSTETCYYYYRYFLSSAILSDDLQTYFGRIPSYSTGTAVGPVFCPFVVFPYVLQWLRTTNIVCTLHFPLHNLYSNSLVYSLIENLLSNNMSLSRQLKPEKSSTISKVLLELQI